MRRHLADITVTDDDWFDFGGDSVAFVRDLVGAKLFEQTLVGFEVTFSTRNWNNQTQTITVTLVAEREEHITWWLLQYTPKKYSE